MPGSVWVVGELAADGVARVTTEVATIARGLADAAGASLAGIVAGADPAPAADALAAYLPRVVAVTVAAAQHQTFASTVAPVIAELARRDEPGWILIGGSPDGRDMAGILAELLDLAVLANASALAWRDGTVVAEASVFGGRLVVTSTVTGTAGIVTVRPNSVVAAPAGDRGVVEDVIAPPTNALPVVVVRDRVAATADVASIEEARIIVSGGRGVGGPAGFAVVEDLAGALGGVVGATRAAVDAGWIPYSQQIGQTGKIVKPQLYLALGISGAIQHKVGMQTADTIVAINRDPDAPIAEFADLVVVGDLFEVAPAIAAELRARTG